MEDTKKRDLSDPQYIKMTRTPVPLLVTKLAIPTTVSMLISSIYNMADTYFVSQLNDTSATGAVSVVFALMAIIQAMGFTVGMGAGSWISRLLGQKNNDHANKVGISALVMGIGLGSLIMIFGKIFSDKRIHAKCGESLLCQQYLTTRFTLYSVKYFKIFLYFLLINYICGCIYTIYCHTDEFPF